jgi:hypothetical protein
MASFVFFNVFTEDYSNEVHDLFGTTDTLKVYLTNDTPTVSGDSIKADLAEITNEHGYTAPVDVQNDGTRSGATVTVTAVSLSITASGGTIGPFRYVVLYNDTPTSPVDPLIGYWDYGSNLTLQDGESFPVKFNGASVGNPGTLLTVTVS